MSAETSAATIGLLDEAAIWKYLHDLFRLPGEAQWRWLHQESTERAFVLLARAVEGGPGELPLPATLAEYEQDYLATFEVGLPHPPAPLIESHWRQDEPAPRVLHQNLLFYRRFGLELRQPSAESADHLRHQLEFMHYLCCLEVKARESARADQAEQLARARREFAAQHLADWVSRAASALGDAAPGSWPSCWLDLLESCCRAVRAA